MASAAALAVLSNTKISVDLNQAATQLGNALSSFSGNNAIVLNGTNKSHNFYCYNDNDYIMAIPAAKPHAGPGCVAICHKSGSGPTIKVYVENTGPEYIVTAGNVFVFNGQGMLTLGSVHNILNKRH